DPPRARRRRRAGPRGRRDGDRVRPLRPPVPGLPERAGPRLGLREQRHGRGGPPAAGRRPLQALLRDLARRGVLVEPVAVGGGAGPPAHRLRAVDRRLGAAVRVGRLRRRHRGRHDRRLDGGVPRADLRAAPRRPLPAVDQPVRELRPVVLARLGRAGRGGVLRQPGAVRARPARRPPGLAAVAAVGAAGGRPGPVGGHHGGAAVQPAHGGAAAGQGHPHRARRVGPRRPARLAVLATAAGTPPPPVLL
ncbi:MAG: hypothetical protein AVDCRST_MAG41-1826, partial [uncultured Corynebacteriales bacterium]